jgi:hypothetical protein
MSIEPTQLRDGSTAPSHEDIRSVAAVRVPTAAELLEALRESESRVEVTNPPMPVRVRLRRSLYALINSDLVPEGQRVKHTGRNRGDMVITLVSVSDDPRPKAPSEPVPIPTDFRRAHPAVKLARSVKRDRGGWIDTRRTADAVHLCVQADRLHRALLLVQALIDEASRRGHGISIGSNYDCPGGLRIVVSGHDYEVTIKEPKRRIDHVPTPEEADRYRRYSSWPPPRWDYEPSGRLEIRLGHDTYGSPLAADRERWQLEDRLTMVVSKLEAKAATDEVKRLESERKKAEQRREWDQVRLRAIKRFEEQHRVNWLEDQLGRWRRAVEIESYVREMRTERALNRDEANWLDWVEEWTRDLHPRTGALAPPPAPDPKPHDLQPYMEGWSADSPTPPFRWTWTP